MIEEDARAGPHPIVDRLEAGESWADLASATGNGLRGVVRAIALDGLGTDDATALPLVRGTPRRPTLLSRIDEATLTRAIPDADRGARLALAAGLLQVQDFWEASHEAAQRADDIGEAGSSAYWHGIGHRREPDAFNANYWFRRVGRHPILASLGEGEPWDPSSLVALAGRARPGSDDERRALRLQRAEMLALIEHSATLAGLA